MTSYEVDHEVDAFKDLVYAASHPPGIVIAAANDCLESWNRSYIQWDMVVYCYKQKTGTGD